MVARTATSAWNRPQATVVLPSQFGGRWSSDEKEEESPRLPTPIHILQRRNYHTTARNDRAVAIMLGLGTIAAVSYSAAQGVKAYNEWKESWPTEEELKEEEAARAKAEEAEQADEQATQQQKKQAPPKEGKRENIFNTWFGVGVGSKYCKSCGCTQG